MVTVRTSLAFGVRGPGPPRGSPRLLSPRPAPCPPPAGESQPAPQREKRGGITEAAASVLHAFKARGHALCFNLLLGD